MRKQSEFRASNTIAEKINVKFSKSSNTLSSFAHIVFLRLLIKHQSIALMSTVGIWFVFISSFEIVLYEPCSFSFVTILLLKNLGMESLWRDAESFGLLM